MIHLRPAGERGLTRLDWLTSRHTFSFGSYRDPRHGGFRNLLVLNDDVVAPATGFGTHGHRDAEIVSYVLAGSLQHRDSLGNGATLAAGDFQYMSAGRGVQHSEWNPSSEEPVHFLQIWLTPVKRGGPPAYAERRAADVPGGEGLAVLFSGRGAPGAAAIRADADLAIGRLPAGARREVPIGAGRAAWVHVVSGRLHVSGAALGPGDGAAVEGEAAVVLTASAPSEFLWFDLA